METLTPTGNRHRACDPCRKRKIKCSQHTPLCRRCDNMRLQCQYSAIKTMGRPRRKKSSQAGDGLRPQARTRPEDELNLSTMFPMGSLPDGLDQDFPDFGPLLPFDSSLHSTPLWPSLPDMPAPAVDATTGSFAAGVGTPAHDIQTLPSPWPSASQQQTLPRPGNKCACLEMVHRHFALADDNDHSFTKTLSHLQSSAASASQILNCSACFDPNNSLYGLSKNIHLLGSLMSSIASTYASFLTYQRKVAMDASAQDDKIHLPIGPDAGVQFRLSGQEYWSLLKTTVGSEIDHVMRLCTSFAERQTKTHSRGHEVCESGKPCHKEEEVVEEDKCPSNVNIAKSYSCFRTVEQVRAAILEARRIVRGEGWGEVNGQQCL
ncbi:uncharacterized protein F5Z01DRAFT_502667 [Emericellopsis atlantica]|uniref:Zn(2)-C6 fungal-type domain-containing protein n=1 Tax=Emericellopsis atlantica TaxID=2614577 RepID=A0A9P7ZR09_9HYPO|nr:uncharacterized protein F5Z01DRAFT_502667 [Emericellopsis atlantica]KAG9256251.1 hypothetical protein F5Z01DRAFT_502667 [Emericellopsis atlantica]